VPTIPTNSNFAIELAFLVVRAHNSDRLEVLQRAGDESRGGIRGTIARQIDFTLDCREKTSIRRRGRFPRSGNSMRSGGKRAEKSAGGYNLPLQQGGREKGRNSRDGRVAISRSTGNARGNERTRRIQRAFAFFRMSRGCVPFRPLLCIAPLTLPARERSVRASAIPSRLVARCFFPFFFFSFSFSFVFLDSTRQAEREREREREGRYGRSRLSRIATMRDVWTDGQQLLADKLLNLASE